MEEFLKQQQNASKLNSFIQYTNLIGISQRNLLATLCVMAIGAGNGKESWQLVRVNSRCI